MQYLHRSVGIDRSAKEHRGNRMKLGLHKAGDHAFVCVVGNDLPDNDLPEEGLRSGPLLDEDDSLLL